MNDRDFDELAAGHALHALSPEEERAFLDDAARDPRRAARARADEAVAARLADAVAPVEPPRRIRSELLASIAQAPQEAPKPGDAEADPADDGDPTPRPAARPSAGRRRWFVLAASVALLLAVGAGGVVAVQQLTRPAAVTALEAIEDAPDARSADAALADGGTVTLHWSPARDSAVLVSEDLPAIDADRQFELWLVRDGAPVSAGVFDPGGEQTVALLDGDLEPGDVVALTVEPAGGSPTGQPTTEPIVAIPTS
jgi:anti-sigma-K factor RskA